MGEAVKSQSLQGVILCSQAEGYSSRLNIQGSKTQAPGSGTAAAPTAGRSALRSHCCRQDPYRIMIRASSCRADSHALASYSIRKFSCLKLPPCFLFDRSLKGITATLTTSKSINKLNTTILLRSTREQGANCYTNKVKTSGHRQPWLPRNGNCHWRQKRVGKRTL